VLVDRELPAGYHEIQLNASPWPSGTYFYSIRADDFRSVKSFVLVK
jgi:hypothetical protein